MEFIVTHRNITEIEDWCKKNFTKRFWQWSAYTIDRNLGHLMRRLEQIPDLDSEEATAIIADLWGSDTLGDGSPVPKTVKFTINNEKNASWFALKWGDYINNDHKP